MTLFGSLFLGVFVKGDAQKELGMLDEGSNRLTDLAAAIADGGAIDWDAVESSSLDEEERVTVRRLRAIADIGRAHAAATLSDSFSLSTSLSAGVEPMESPEPGMTWGSLRIVERIGRGRFGDVYRAWDPSLDREVALKLLRHRDADPDTSAKDQEVVEEGRLMARVRHPNVVTIFGAQRLDGRTGLWMEYIPGRTLEAELKERGPFSAAEVAQVGIALCRALAAVHAAGLVHRDVKAQNVLRDPRGHVLLGDFGTGRELDDEDPIPGIAGTPAYLAPEVFRREPATPQSDLYSLGALLFHLATGSFPVSGRSVRELRDAHSEGRRTSIQTSRPNLLPSLAAVIETALNPDPARRFSNAAAMETALAAAIAPRSKLKWLIAAGTLAVAGVVLAFAVSPDGQSPSGGGGAASAASGDNSEPTRSQGDRAVLTGPSVSGFGTVTPDGRFMTYVDFVTSQVMLRDLRNGTDRPLTSGTRAYIARDARELTAISRDGTQVAFEWATPNSGEIELRLANLEGTGVPESRRLLAFKLDDALAISVFDWSPDGKWLVVSIQRTDLVGQLSLVSVQDGSHRVLKSIGWTGPHRAFFSPDGRSLAHSVPADDTFDESRVFVMAVDGSRERVVVDHPSRNIIMGWSPDGGSVLFSSNRGGSAGLWMVPVTDGQSVRTATLLKPNIGSSWSLGVTSSGALFTWKSTVARYLQVAPADVDLRTASTGPASAFQIFLGRGGNPVWSPDGKYLAYMHGDLDENFSCCGTFTIRSTDGRVVRRLPQRLSYLQRFAWSLDGRALIGPGRDVKGRWGTYRVDVETGEPTRIGDGVLLWTSESPAHRTMMANTTLDGTKHFFSSYARSTLTNVEVRVDPREGGQIIERDLSSGTERVVAERVVVPAPGGLAMVLESLFLSPDTRYIAFGQALQSSNPSSRTPGNNALFIVPATGGTPRELFRGVGRMVWTSDSRALLALKAPPDPQELWVVPIDGSAPRNLGIEVHDSTGQIPFSLRPDGRQIAFVAGDASPYSSEIWRIENFLPAPNTSR